MNTPTLDNLLDTADLSLGFYDMSLTATSNVAKNLPDSYSTSSLTRVYDETTLRLYLRQLFSDVASNKYLSKKAKKTINSLSPSLYGHDYLLGFHFLPQTEPIEGGKRKIMYNKPVALPRKMVETSLPSQRDYGFKSGEKHPIFTSYITDVTVFEVTIPTVGIRHQLKGNLDHVDTENRLPLVERYGYTLPDGRGYSRVEPSETHKTPLETRADHKTLESLGYKVVLSTKYEDPGNPMGFYGESSDGTINPNIQTNKSALGFSADKFKNTKTKISWGGGTSAPTYLSDYYAYASRYYRFDKFSTKKVRFLLANGTDVWYQVDNNAPQSLAKFVEIDGETVVKLNDNIEITTNDTVLDIAWRRCQQWSKTAVRTIVSPENYTKVQKQQQRKQTSLSKASKSLDRKIRKLQAVKAGV